MRVKGYDPSYVKQPYIYKVLVTVYSNSYYVEHVIFLVSHASTQYFIVLLRQTYHLKAKLAGFFLWGGGTDGGIPPFGKNLVRIPPSGTRPHFLIRAPPPRRSPKIFKILVHFCKDFDYLLETTLKCCISCLKHLSPSNALKCPPPPPPHFRVLQPAFNYPPRVATHPEGWKT